MAMFDPVVSGETHVLPGGAVSVGLAVAGGKIVGVIELPVLTRLPRPH
jgi:hypothetical protein